MDAQCGIDKTIPPVRDPTEIHPLADRIPGSSLEATRFTLPSLIPGFMNPISPSRLTALRGRIVAWCVVVRLQFRMFLTAEFNHRIFKPPQ